MTKAKRKELDEQGREIIDPVPMAPPVGFTHEPSMIDQVRAMIRGEHSRLAQEAGAETFDEADDFDVGDDYDAGTPYEEVFDPLDEAVREALRQREFRDKFILRMREEHPDFGKEFDNASKSDEGGTVVSDGGGGGNDPVDKGKSGADKSAAVEGGVRSGSKKS